MISINKIWRNFLDSRLKILHTESSVGWGGQELRICLESKFHSSRGHIVALASSHDSQFQSRGDFFGEIYSINFSKSFSSLFSLKSVIKAVKPDLIVCHSSTDSWVATIAKLIWFKNVALVRVRHVRANVRPSLLNRWFYNQASFIVSTSEDIRRHLIAVLGLDPSFVESIPTGVDVDKFKVRDQLSVAARNWQRILPIGSRDFVLIMVSTLRSWKGHRYVINAMQLLTECHLLIVGDGPQDKNLKKIALENGVTDRVTFCGFQSDVAPFLEMADVFLQPSLANEGVSQSLLQAGAMGIPVIASNIGGLNEVIVQNETGLLVEPKSDAEIARAVEIYRGCASLRKHVSRSFLVKIDVHHSAVSMAIKMEDVFQRAIERNNSRYEVDKPPSIL